MIALLGTTAPTTTGPARSQLVRAGEGRTATRAAALTPGRCVTTGGPPKYCTGLVLDDEFPLSMFPEALGKESKSVKESTAGTRATEA